MTHRLKACELRIDVLLVQVINHRELLLGDDAGGLEGGPWNLRAEHLVVRNRTRLDAA